MPPHVSIATPNRRDVTLLWALRSPCNLGCRYCYFGTLPEHREEPPTELGQLSHLSRADLSLADVTRFVGSLADSAVARIFVAGGEPLIWPPILPLIRAIKEAGVELVVCTNGIPLNRPEIVSGLLDIGVDAVSVSLDSATQGHNDRWRPPHNRRDGWQQVVSGIRALLVARSDRPRPAVGLYTVVTAENIDAITDVAAFAEKLGCDYFVPQPLSLGAGHALDGQLSLTEAHAQELTAQFNALYRNSTLRLPDASYPQRVLDSIIQQEPSFVASCFGGRYLHFVEPDGTVWPCPSSYKIASLADLPIRNIRDTSAADLFEAGGSCADCALFSRDCVNMWPLTEFTTMIVGGAVQ
jgi:MoaA/NifB/PqqE/SkfB family radical SAM enzyme